MGATKSVKVGMKLRHARLTKGMTLLELAQRVECSESLLSKIENDRVRPSVRVLHKLASALETNITRLFQEDSADADIVLRDGERTSVVLDDVGGTVENLMPRADSRLLQAVLMVIQPGGSSQGTYEHVGEEVGYMLDGTLELTVGERTFLVSSGDSFSFRSDQPHGYRNPTEAPARLLWINTPPTW